MFSLKNIIFIFRFLLLLQVFLVLIYVFNHKTEKNPSSKLKKRLELPPFQRFSSKGCQLINKNFSFRFIEIDGAQYPKYDPGNILDGRYNFECLRDLRTKTKKIFIWFNFNDSNLVTDTFSECPVKNCILLLGKRLQIREADAIVVNFFNIVHGKDKSTTQADLNYYRKPNQRWVEYFTHHISFIL